MPSLPDPPFSSRSGNLPAATSASGGRRRHVPDAVRYHGRRRNGLFSRTKKRGLLNFPGAPTRSGGQGQLLSYVTSLGIEPDQQLARQRHPDHLGRFSGCLQPVVEVSEVGIIARPSGSDIGMLWKEKTGIPRPSALVTSGRGMHAKWCYSEPVRQTCPPMARHLESGGAFGRRSGSDQGGAPPPFSDKLTRIF